MRRKSNLTTASAALLCLVLIGGALGAAERAPRVAKRSVTNTKSRGLAAIDNAARSDKYLFVYFWKDNGSQSRKSYDVFKSAMAKWTLSAESIGIRLTDPNEKAIVQKLDVSRAPMPLVVALAPNGAVTKAWPIRFTEQQLREGFVSPCTAQCLKALQDSKLVVLYVPSQNTPQAQTALKGIQDFKADARFVNAAEIITVNPTDASEKTFLADLQIKPGSTQPTTVVLAPPGQPIAQFTGAVTKQQIIAKVTSAKSGCCPDGQCCPGGKCGPRK